MKKNKLLCLLLCVVMVAGLAIPGSLAVATASASSKDVRVLAGESPVKTVAVPQSGSVSLTASGEDVTSGKWQILAGGETWVDIQGQTAASIKLNYAMVANLMPTSVRFVTGERTSEPVDVSIAPAEPFPAQGEFQRPTASEAPVAVDNAPAVDLEALAAALTTLEEETIPALQTAYDNAKQNTQAAQSALDAQAPADAQAMPGMEEAPGEDTAPIEAPADPSALEADLTAAQNAEAQALAALEAAQAEFDQKMTEYTQYAYGTMTLDGPGEEVAATHSVVINYVFADNSQAASPYTANVAHGSALNVTVNSPAVLGYTPSEATVTINETVNADITKTVTYSPALVNYTVKHYQQNLNDDNYTLVDTETKQGYTESPVAGEQTADGKWTNDQAKTYSGFYALLYDGAVKIAADGSTVVEIYYDRYYYLMNFDLDGGYGVEPIYARYGAPIEWKTPVKQGYTFAGWTPSASGVDTMPAENMTFTANWNIHDKVPVTVIFWGENPNDEGYSYDHSGSVQAEPGKDFTFSENYQFIICGQEAHTHTADCTYACGKTEHTHNGAACGYACGDNEHHHSAACGYKDELHTHGTSCYADVGEKNNNTPMGAPRWPEEGQVYVGAITGRKFIYIGGSWYKYTGNLVNHSIASTICGKPVHTQHNSSCYACGDNEHTHSASCGYACGQEAHQHSDACGTSCGKTEHQHIASCYQNGAGMDPTLWTFKESQTVTVAPDGSSIINVYYERTEFTMHFRDANSYRDDYGTITAKWGAAIGDQFMAKNNQAGVSSWSEKSNGTSPWTSYWDIMLAENRTYYAHKTSGSDNIATYYTEDLNGQYQVAFTVNSKSNSGFTVTVNEDFPDLEGFTKNFDKSSKDGANFNGAKFYYDRKSYKLDYMNSGTKLEDRTATVKYEAPLTSYKITPPYPDNLEPNAYKFDGWYDDQYFQQPVNWNSTMPASDKIVYAKWVPVTHTVTFALDKNAQPGLYDAQTVPHGSKITTVANPTNGSYTFVGWFYTDESGVEKAFDPMNMPVNRDLNLYGKWSANTMVPYTIKYATYVDGVLTYIADDTTGNALALTTKTFEAKTGADLYEGYRSGYFPKEASHSIVMSADEGAENTFTFIYVPKEKVPYTVRYLEQGTNKELHEEKKVETPDAIVTETFVPVTGYMPDAYQKRLIISANEDENVITFWYVKDDTHAPLHIVHYVQNIEGDGYTVYQESTDINAIIGQDYSENALTIPGFQYNEGKSTASGTMTAEGLELVLYYDRIEYPYEFKFLEQGTDKILADPTTGNARYQAQVSLNAKVIPGYDCVTPSPQAMTIAIEDPADIAKNNVRIFYYQEKKVTIEYKVVGPDGQIDTAGNIGTATPASETIKVRTDVASGSTAAPKDNTYKFVGWFKDAACTQPVDESWITDTTHITPAKTGDKNDAGEAQTYEAATYYAKFEYNLTSMTISKGGTAYDGSDTFIFDIFDKDNKKVTTVTMKMGGSVTISGLTVGETYTVKERTDGTRYEKQENKTCALKPTASENTVTFTNSVKTNTWLTSSKTVPNVFKGND